MANNFSQKSRKKYVCEVCTFESNNKTDYNKHIVTIKHLSVTMANEMANDSARNLAKLNINKKLINSKKCYEYQCDCGKQYRHKSSLCKHKKTCNIIVDIKENNSIEKNNSIEENVENLDFKDIVCKLISENKDIKDCLIRENQELKQQLQEKDNQISNLIPRIGNNLSLIHI